MKNTETHLGNIVDLFNEEIYPAEVHVRDGIIISIKKSATKTNSFIIPGFIDSHIHIESSMLTPQHFARIALSHGTVAVVSDPHEIANVLGIEGVKYMLENASGSEMQFYFGAPSCVPATNFESSGAEISLEDIESLFCNQNLSFLSEVMNYPGVLNSDELVMQKIKLAKKYNRNIDGHAPGLSGENLLKYINAGIETDHECSVLEEAIEKIEGGMKIQIREGSAAKNFDALWPLIDLYPAKVFLCCDDLHPDDLMDGHMNRLLKLGIQKGINLFNLLRTVTVNPVTHYKLNLGLLRVGDSADFVKVDDLVSFKVSQTFIKGKKVYDRESGLPRVGQQKIINHFNCIQIKPDTLRLRNQNTRIKVISAFDGELLTKSFTAVLPGKQYLESDPLQDILKLVVINRYFSQPPAIAFIHNFSIKQGAIASSVAHDCHNIIAVGVSDVEISDCINWIISNRGGLAINDGNKVHGISLPIAGIISDKPAETVSSEYRELNNIARDIGCGFKAPFMTLSFMALLVIPELKLSNNGLFDSRNFTFTNLFEN